MPPAFYRVADGHYVSGDHYETLRAVEGVDLPDRSQATILFPANNGRSLMSGRQMAVIARDAFADIRQQEGLPESVARLHDSTPPRALVYMERTGELLSPDNARRQLGGDNLLEQVPEQHVFLSNFQHTGRQTGNLSNATAYRERNPEELRQRLENDVAGANREERLPGAGGAHAVDVQPSQTERAMPPAFYRVADGHYVSGDHYEAIRAADGVDLPDRSQATILFPANNGRSLMSGRQMAVIAPDAFAGIRQQEGLPETVNHRHDSTPPRALVYLERTGELLSPDNARRQLGTDDLLEQVPEQHVFLSNFQNTGRQTGNLSNATAYRERNHEELRERLENDIAGANREEGLPGAGAGVAYAAAAQPQLAEARQPAEFPPQAPRAMPPAFYRVSEGRYVDVDHYETLRADPEVNLPARSEAAILFPADTGRTLMSGREMANHNYQEFADIRRQEGLPGSVQQSHDNEPPARLVYLEGTRELLSHQNALRQLDTDDVLEHAPSQHVFLSDLDGSGRQTGNFTNAPQSLGTDNPETLRRVLTLASFDPERELERRQVDRALAALLEGRFYDEWRDDVSMVESSQDDVSMEESLQDDVSMAESWEDDDIPQAMAIPEYALPMAPPTANQRAAQQQVEIPLAAAIPVDPEMSRQGSPAAQYQAEMPLANARIIGNEMDYEPSRDDLRDRERNRERDGR